MVDGIKMNFYSLDRNFPNFHQIIFLKVSLIRGICILSMGHKRPSHTLQGQANTELTMVIVTFIQSIFIYIYIYIKLYSMCVSQKFFKCPPQSNGSSINQSNTTIVLGHVQQYAGWGSNRFVGRSNIQVPSWKVIL